MLVDTSPDLREQLLDARIGRLDGVLISHDHADQTHGMDDLRAITDAFDVTVNVPLALPADAGSNDTLNVALCPAVSVTGVVIPLKLLLGMCGISTSHISH